MSKLLLDRSLAYLNVDSSVNGHDYVFISATPLLYSLIYEATKMVPTLCEVLWFLYLW